jgi:hypothetical protein
MAQISLLEEKEKVERSLKETNMMGNLKVNMKD